MSRTYKFLAIFCLIIIWPLSVFATNGDNLIGVGPNSRSMGGVGIAAPQDAIGAVFANPAAMSFSPFCPGSEFNFAGTLFMPKVNAKIELGGITYAADSERKTFGIPAIGLSTPINKSLPYWRFGLAAYGISGLGVDYRDTDLDQSKFYDFGEDPNGKDRTSPLIAGEFTQLQIMKFAPAVAYQPNSQFSLGLALHIDYANLDLGNGASFNYGYGVQLGTVYKLGNLISLGATYITPQKVEYKNITDFDGDGSRDNLDLESPQELGVGVALHPMSDKLLLEMDGKWVNWGNAKGYNEFGWKDQWVFSFGAQFKPTQKLSLRAGFNYGKNPIEMHDNFVGYDTNNPDPLNHIQVQGKSMPTYYYETFRFIGFPAIVQSHLALGIGYEFTKNFDVHAGYMHAFKKEVKESGIAINGQPVTLESGLSEDSIDFSLTWRY
ncbi:MAG: OmpP1/FadL family transporter [bacterium]